VLIRGHVVMLTLSWTLFLQRPAPGVMSGTTVGVLAALLFYLHIAYADETTIYAFSTIQQSNTVGVNNAQIAGPLISWEYVVNSSSKKYKFL
jgi:hypothetical protein